MARPAAISPLCRWGRRRSPLGGQDWFGQTRVPPALTNLIAVVDRDAAIALQADGTLVAWGADRSGEDLPDLVPAGWYNLVAIVSSGPGLLALRDNGTVLDWADGAPPLRA